MRKERSGQKQSFIEVLCDEQDLPELKRQGKDIYKSKTVKKLEAMWFGKVNTNKQDRECRRRSSLGVQFGIYIGSMYEKDEMSEEILIWRLFQQRMYIFIHRI